jgi:hypothetical protein
MKVYHGTDNRRVNFKIVKNGVGYHPGAGPVEFLGPSFSDSKAVAQSYGKFVIEKEIAINRPKRFRSLGALRNSILKTFSLVPKINLGAQYRDIADSYRAKLLAEGYDAVLYPEGIKTETEVNIANTIIPLKAV